MVSIIWTTYCGSDETMKGWIPSAVSQFRSFALSKPIVLPRKAMRIRSVLELPDTWKSNSTSIHIDLFLNDVHDEAETLEI